MIFAKQKLRPVAAAAALAAALLAAAPQSAKAVVAYNNLGSSQDGSDPVFGVGPLAASFSSASGGVLASLQLLLTNGNSSADPGSIDVRLIADNHSSPGVVLADLGSIADKNITTSPAIYALSFATPFVLAANTEYWIELVSSAAPSAVEWSWSLDQSAPGVAGQQVFGQSFGVLPNSGGAYQFAVLVPEPGTVALFTGGLVALGLTRRSRAA